MPNGNGTLTFPQLLRQRGGGPAPPAFEQSCNTSSSAAAAGIIFAANCFASTVGYSKSKMTHQSLHKSIIMCSVQPKLLCQLLQLACTT
jgi:hypothetical protein